MSVFLILKGLVSEYSCLLTLEAEVPNISFISLKPICSESLPTFTARNLRSLFRY
jgi:hypothetical protein